ncbi:PspC domain-containing protein [Candidatus Saccharibacteria bacterium]|nr:PspC domain-containing protein [Candidatus Saccharibacteria bacterium]
MKKVVMVNLNGRAYQVEEDGYNELKSYLEKAGKTLGSNPDKEEIIADIEQAVADKCDGELVGAKNVVSTEAVGRILGKIGPVQEGSDDENIQLQSVADAQRKLYRLPKEGKIAGVCAGLAAYFGTDTTIMRLIFVILVFVTQGIMILVYLLLAIAMPEAKKPEDIAEAYGRPNTAKEIVGRIKDAATDRDTVQRIGDVINIVGKAIAKLLMYISAVIFGSLSLLWVWLIGTIGLGGAQLHAELAALNGIKQIVFVTAVYVVVAMPFFITVRVMERIGREEYKSRGDDVVYGTLVAMIVAATVVISAYFSVYTNTVGTYLDNNNGQFQIGSHVYCVDEAKCGDGAH